MIRPKSRGSDRLSLATGAGSSLRIELMVEMSGLEARGQAIRRIRDEQQRFCTLFQAREGLAGTVEQLRDTLKHDQEVIDGITSRLKNPPVYMRLPEVYQNKIVIHPIEGVYTQN